MAGGKADLDRAAAQRDAIIAGQRKTKLDRLVGICGVLGLIVAIIALFV